MRTAFDKRYRESGGDTVRRRGMQRRAPLSQQRASLPFTCSTALVLPSFHRGVPLRPKTGFHVKSTIFEALAECGVMQPTHWRGSLLAAGATALSAMNECRIVNVGMAYGDDIERKGGKSQPAIAPDNADHFRKLFKVPEYHKVGYAVIVTEVHKWFSLRWKVEAMESVKPDLGIALYGTLIRAMKQTVGCVSGDELLELAKQEYWGYENDEKSRIEEHLSEEGVEDPRGSGRYRPYTKKEKATALLNVEWYRRAQFDKSFPKWCWSPEFRSKHRIDYKKVQGTLKNETAEQLVTLAIEVERLLSGWEFDWYHQFDWNESTFSELASPLVLRMNEQDDAVRITDDVYAQHSAASHYVMDLCCGLMFDADDIKSISEAFLKFQKLFQILRAAEQMLPLLGVLEDR